MGLFDWLAGRTGTPQRPEAGRPTPVTSRKSIYRSEFLDGEAELRALQLGPDGLPRLQLVRQRGQFVLEAPGQGWISPRSRQLYKTGIVSFRVRGAAYHQDALTRAPLRPGATVRLVREPENEHDPHAVALYPGRGGQRFGYVNKQNAVRLAKRLDAGEELIAICTRGSAAGRDDEPVMVLVATVTVMERLLGGNA